MSNPASDRNEAVADVDDFLRRLRHVDPDILVWIRSLLAERAATERAMERLARDWVASHRSSRDGFEAGERLAAFWEDWWDANMAEPWPLPRVAHAVD